MAEAPSKLCNVKRREDFGWVRPQSLERGSCEGGAHGAVHIGVHLKKALVGGKRVRVESAFVQRGDLLHEGAAEDVVSLQHRLHAPLAPKVLTALADKMGHFYHWGHVIGALRLRIVGNNRRNAFVRR